MEKTSQKPCQGVGTMEDNGGNGAAISRLLKSPKIHLANETLTKVLFMGMRKFGKHPRLFTESLHSYVKPLLISFVLGNIPNR